MAEKEKKKKNTVNGSVSIQIDLIPIWDALKGSNRSGIVQLILKTAALCDDPNEVERMVREMYYSKMKEKGV